MKKIIAAAMLAALAVTGATFAAAKPKPEKCAVETVEGDKVTITCKDTALKAGDKVEVRVKEDKPVEGC
uniref:selenite/tellurite reduction operon protein ExtJ n=1 Tax=Candidatus Electronema sp. TaxID=2698783 RepID=UPI004055D049